MTADSSRAWVALGSNLGDRLSHLRHAVSGLAALAHTEIVAASKIYETRPMGPSEHPFLNAAVELRTKLAPEDLLGDMLKIERARGRNRAKRWAARTLDLDLLAYWPAGAQQPLRWHSATLRLPHPELRNRDFVLAPLLDLDVPWPIDGGHSVREALAVLGDEARTVLRARPEALLPPDPPC